MRFVEGSWYHFLYILSPFLILALLYFLLKDKSEKTKYLVGLAIGILSLVVICARNIDIYVREGFDPQIIPLQICHFGNIAVFISLVFKNKTAAAMTWTLNLIPAFSSLILADALAGYQNIFTSIRAQAYIWGHLLIVVGALYPVIFKVIKFDKKAFLRSVYIASGLLVVAVVANTYFTDFLGRNINYFYIYNSRGVPFQMFYNLTKPVTIGSWFTFNPGYVISLIILGITVVFLMYGLSRLFYREKEIKETTVTKTVTIKKTAEGTIVNKEVTTNKNNSVKKSTTTVVKNNKNSKE